MFEFFRRFGLIAVAIAAWTIPLAPPAPGVALAPVIEATPTPYAPLAAHAMAWGRQTTPDLIAEAEDRGDIDTPTADLYLAWALSGDARLPTRYLSNAPWRGTLYARRVLANAAAYRRAFEPGLLGRTAAGDAYAAAEAALAGGSCGGYGSGTPVATVSSTHFFVEQYAAIGGGLAITDYTTILEQVWQREVGDYGFAAPPAYPVNPAPGGRFHVVVTPLSGGLYGFATQNGTYAGFVGDNPNTAWTETSSQASCLVLREEYSSLYFGSDTLGFKALEATVAHEFFHGVQYGEGAVTPYSLASNRDLMWIESMTTLIEDEVFDSSNDNFVFLYPNLTTCLGFGSYSNRYANWLVLRAMTERYGHTSVSGVEQVAQDFFEATSMFGDTRLDALTDALAGKGATIADNYHEASIALKFMRGCGGGYFYPYCLAEGPAYMAAKGALPTQGAIGSFGTNYLGTIANHYASNWVTLPGTAVTYSVAITNTGLNGELRASAVCDTGSGFRISPLGLPLHAGESAKAQVNAAGCVAVAAVVTNQEQTSSAPSSCPSTNYTLAAEALGALPTPTVTPTASPSPTPTPTPTPGPTGLTVASFAAKRNGTTADLNWTTLSEFDTNGFKLYRKTGIVSDTVAPGDAAQIGSLVLANGFASTYQVSDPSITDGVAYSYWLVRNNLIDVDFPARRTLLGAGVVALPVIVGP